MSAIFCEQLQALLRSRRLRSCRSLLATLLCCALELSALGLIVAAPVRASESSPIAFREVSREWGLTFRHHHGGSGQRYMVETLVGGVVIFDYDGDGDDDVFFVDGGVLPGYQGAAPGSRLFRNESGRFVDVTERAGIVGPAYGCGAVAADVDNDGDLDLYITAFGPNVLLRNRGDGSFEVVAGAPGSDLDEWSAGAAFADVDRDGDLDLYVANYVDYRLASEKSSERFCGDRATGVRGYCHPDVFEGVPDRFYRNLGGGAFEEQTAAAGLEAPGEAGLGVAFGDLDGDGWPDLYVANDKDPNFFFRNLGNGKFENLSLLSGSALSPQGTPEAGMGVEIADLDSDGRQDVFVTNFALETNAYYWNAGDGIFVDRRFAANVAEPSLMFLGFGAAAADLDLDGDLDLVIANGHILDNAEELSQVKQYAQRDQVLENLGDGASGAGRFRAVESALPGPPTVGRGLATGDLDLDGDVDLVIVNSNQNASVWENLTEGSARRSDDASRPGWLAVDLRGRRSNVFAIGAEIRVRAADGSVQLRERRTGSSYLSQNSLSAHFGLSAQDSRNVEVEWPSGTRQRVRWEAPDRRLVLVEP